MTDKERIEILQRAKLDIRNGNLVFICPTLERLYADKSGDGVFKVFPELKKHKPQNCNLYGAWFGGQEGKFTRLKVLDKLITEIKAKSNA